MTDQPPQPPEAPQQPAPGWGPPAEPQPPKPKRQFLVTKIAIGVAAGITLFLVGSVVVLGMLLASGSDSGKHAAAPAAAATTRPSPEVAFLAQVRALQLGNKDLAGSSDDELLAVGRSLLDAVDTAAATTGNLDAVIEGVMTSDAHPTRAEAEAFLRAVTNLDPANTYLLDTIKAPTAPTKPKPAPAPEFGEGTYKVGVDIKPGLYKATVTSGMGYWARLADPDGNNILANDVKTSGTMYLRVRSTDKYIEISGTTFHKVG
jgi:hypothetical protein